FFLGNGGTRNTSAVIGANSRATVNVYDAVGFGQEVSTRVGPASQGIVVERPVYFSGRVGPDSSDFSAFTGTWYGHGRGVTIGQDGSGTASWRTYRWCTDSPPPCDYSMGNEIISGGQAEF